jgi:hypothetical protein
MSWLILTYKVPSEPSSHRVAVWRELRRLRAISIQQAVSALPDSKPNRRALYKLAARISDVGGAAFLLEARAMDHQTKLRLEEAYTALLDEELGEFLDECCKYEEEIRKEIRTRKFTQAELAEEEEAFERLERWLSSLLAKDLLGSDLRDRAEHALKAASSLLDDFARQVFEFEQTKGANA